MRHSRLMILVALVILLVAVPAYALRLTATQSILLEYGHDGPGAIGTIALDLALTPSSHVTYIHDRSWLPGARAQIHDVSVTRVMAHNRTATLGWRVKVPEGGDSVGIGYVLVTWRWAE